VTPSLVRTRDCGAQTDELMGLSLFFLSFSSFFIPRHGTSHLLVSRVSFLSPCALFCFARFPSRRCATHSSHTPSDPTNVDTNESINANRLLEEINVSICSPYAALKDGFYRLLCALINSRLLFRHRNHRAVVSRREIRFS